MDFRRLTSLQEWLLLYQGWQVGQKWPDGTPWPQPRKATVRKLLERGLIEERVRVLDHRPVGMTVTEYFVPIAVHMAYCLECSSKYPKAVA